MDDEIPLGFEKLRNIPSRKSYVLVDDQFPGFIEMIITYPLPLGWVIALPKNASSYGFTTQTISYPAALMVVNKNKKDPKRITLISPTEGKRVVLRTKLVPGEGLILPDHPPIGKKFTIPKNLPSGVKVRPEYLAPPVPLPFKVVSKDSSESGKTKIQDPSRTEFIVFTNPNKPGLEEILPLIPPTMKLLLPDSALTKGFSVFSVSQPTGFRIAGGTIRDGEEELPKPKWTEKLVMTDSEKPGIITIMPTPPPGQIFVIRQPPPSNIVFYTMSKTDLDSMEESLQV
jgi:hypothetical protein